MPFVGVDAEGYVNFYVLDAADVAPDFPGKLPVCCPCGAHAEECGVRHGLRVCGDAVVDFGAEVDLGGVEAGEDAGNARGVVARVAVGDDDLVESH